MMKPKKPGILDRLRQRKQVWTKELVGVTWYTEENWVRVKATARDPDRFEASFAEWTAMAEEAFSDIEATGVRLAKILIDADEYASWCTRHHKENTASARAEFVSDKLRILHDSAA